MPAATAWMEQTVKRQYPLDPRMVARGYSVNEYGASDDKIVDPKQALRALRRRLPLFLAALVATFLAVAILTFQTIPVYSSSASIIIDPSNDDVLSIDLGSQLTGAAPDSAVVDTEVEIIRSRSLAEKIVRDLKLNENPEFNPLLREPGAVDRLKASIKNTIANFSPSDAQVSAPSTATSEEAKAQREMDLVVTTLLNKTSARRIGTTYGIEISANSHDPELAAEIANAIADQYLVEQLDAKFDATKRQTAWLEDRLSDLRAEVAEAESVVEAYRSASGLISAGETTINEQQMADVNGQLIVQRAELAEAEARLNSVRSMMRQGLGADTSGEALRSPVISELRRQQADLARQRNDIQNRYGPRHPEYKRITTEESNIQAQIDTEVSRIVANLESEVSISRQRVNSLEGNLNRMRATISDNNRARVRLREMERSADASRSIYEAFLESFKLSDESEGMTQADARILSRAAVPSSPAFPKTTLNLVIGFMLGLLLGVLAVILAESLNNQVNAGSDVEDAFGVPFLGNFPKLTGDAKKNPAEYVVENPMSSFAESFRNLRASIMFADLDSTVQTVAITSSQPDEGKTTISYGLGRMSAMSGSKTLVIDGDFRRKQLTEKAGLEPEMGFLECLFGEAKLSQAIVVDPKTSLHILPLTPDRHTPRDVFGSKAFNALLDRLKEEYELIIIDTGPLLLMAETRVLTSKVDQTVVIARWQKTNRTVLKQTLGILADFRANIAGVVMNQVDLNKYHKHGYGHSGYKAYAKYYSKG